MKKLKICKLLILFAIVLVTAGAIATFAIDIPCGGEFWPPCDLNLPTKGGGGN